MIHVLCADISSADASTYAYLYAQASSERKQRAQHYLRQEDKLRCVVAEALLKTALGTDRFQIEKNDCGKPYIQDRPDFYYNLSHSGRYVVIAWGKTEVGIDVQQHDATTNREAIAARFFAPDEQEYARQDLQRFYEIWTKKESFLKYNGKGLHMALRSFSVLDPALKRRFFHRHLPDGYSLSLCTEEDIYELTRLDVQQLIKEACN